MKIILAAPTPIPARRANTVQVMKMAQAFTALGHQVDLLSPTFLAPGKNTDTSPFPGWDELASHYGLKHTFPIHWLPANPKLRGYDYSKRAYLWARRNGCDLYYTRLIQSASIASLSGTPTLLEIHDLPVGYVGPWVFRLFLHGRGARRLAVITQALAGDLNRLLGAPLPGKTASDGFTVIAPDGVDLERFADFLSPVEARRLLANTALKVDSFTAGYTGHLYAGRGVELILELARRLPKIQFLVVGGEPSDVERVFQISHQMRLKNLVLTGFIPNADLPNYQAACDVLLMPYEKTVSASSGGDIARYLSPMKLFEYMACERVILSSNLPPLLEVLNERNAMILPTQEPDAWTSALQEMQKNPVLAQRLAKQARQDVSCYTWETRATNLLFGLF